MNIIYILCKIEVLMYGHVSNYEHSYYLPLIYF